MAVSVVIPTYNATPFIAETLASVFAQTRLPDEVIVVDDCSPDGTVALVESIAATAPVPVRVIRLPANSGGPSAPMNAGVRASESDILVLLDQDDLMAPERIARHCEGFERPGVGFNFGWITRIDGAGVRHPGFYMVEPSRVIGTAAAEVGPGVWSLDSPRVYTDLLLHGALASASNLAFRKSLWVAVGGFREDLQFCWDCEFLCQATRRSEVAYIDTCLTYYRLHGGNFHKVSPRFAAEWIAFLASHYANPLWPLDRASLAAVIREAYMDRGYRHSTAGQPIAAAKAYATALRYGASPRTSAWRTTKAFARAARDCLRPGSAGTTSNAAGAGP